MTDRKSIRKKRKSFNTKWQLKNHVTPFTVDPALLNGKKEKAKSSTLKILEHHKQILEQKSSISCFYSSPHFISSSCLEVLQKYFMKISISKDCDLESNFPVYFVDSEKTTLRNLNLIQLLSNSTDVNEVASLKELQRNLSVENFKDLETIKGIHYKSVAGKLVLCLPGFVVQNIICLLYTSPSPRDATLSRMPSSA